MAGLWVLVATTLLTLHQATSAPIVDTPWGRILGLDAVSVSGLNYRSYLAIPYALSPVGRLRLAKPVAHPGFGDDQVFNATTLGDQCLQPPSIFISDKVGMSEDCLTLNVYVPVSPSNGPKSVMVWIYGGGFMNGGAATYTPSEIVTENDVIVVVIQYRVNVLGFLSSGDGTVPGNFGLWDQNLAIRWVKTNIGAFGGDPESLTIFGESAGAISVGFQILSPASKGLTFRAILQSATPLTPWAINRNPDRAFFTLAKQTGCLDRAVSRRTGRMRFFISRRTRKRVLECLRGLDGRELIRELEMQEGVPFLASLMWLPVVDGKFVPQDPARLLSDVTYLEDVGATKRDVMLGVTNDEGAIFVNNDMFFDDIRNSSEGRSEVIRRLLADYLIFLFGEDLQKEPQRLETLVDVLEFFYTQWSNNGAKTASLQNVSNIVADTNYVVSTVMVIRDLAKAKAKTSAFWSPLGRLYLYLFNHFPTFKANLPELGGTSHGDDLSYEFDPMPELGNRQGFTDIENDIGFIFRAMLASFAKTGEPEVLLLNNQANGVIMWPEFTLTDEKYLSLERLSRVDKRLFGSRVALWTDLVPSLLSSTLAAKPTRYRLC